MHHIYIYNVYIAYTYKKTRVSIALMATILITAGMKRSHKAALLGPLPARPLTPMDGMGAGLYATGAAGTAPALPTCQSAPPALTNQRATPPAPPLTQPISPVIKNSDPTELIPTNTSD